MALSPTKKKKIRDSMTSYCAQAVGNQARIHYSQARPFRYYDHIGTWFVVLDCSGFVDNVYWNAMHDTEIWLADPCGFRYTGIGNTATIEAFMREHGKQITEKSGYWVGDVARYGEGNHAHITVCSKNGTAKTSQWTSHGQESGPEYRTLDYRPDLIGVWRHPALL